MLKTFMSLLFYMTFVSYIFLGIYGLLLNLKGRTNKAFGLMCLCFSIWAFAFAVSNSSSNYEEVLAWRKFAAVGWGFAFSVNLHFISLLTGDTRFISPISRKVVLYIPSIVTVFVFALYPPIANGQYQLVHTSAGWGNIPINNGWDIFYNVYYLSFSLLGFYLLARWMKKSTGAPVRKQALLLMGAFAVAMILGTITEMIANSILTTKRPSLAPIFIMFPVASFFYCMKKYGLLAVVERKRYSEEGKILSEAKHSDFLKLISIVYIVGAVMNYIRYLDESTSLMSVLLFSTVYVLFGVALFSLPFLGIKLKTQDTILTWILGISIFITAVRFMGDAGGNVVWPASIILMMMTIVFNNTRMFTVVAGITLFSGAVAWVFAPDISMPVDAFDYVARLIFYGITIFLAAYINRTYMNRLKENDRYLAYQKMITSISADFVKVTEGDFSDKVFQLLRESGLFTNGDRCYLILRDQTSGEPYIANRWNSDQAAKASKEIPYGEEEALREIFHKLKESKRVIKEESPSDGIRSMVLVPVLNRELLVGALCFEQLGEKKEWHIGDLNLLMILSNILTEAMKKIAIGKEINYLAYYDGLTGLPNRTLFSNRLEQSIQLARRTNKHIGVGFIDLDGFKSVNDTLGHEWGDKLLIHISERLTTTMRKYDTVSRFGGDEFLFMTPQVGDVEDIESIIRKVMNLFQQPISLEGQTFYITASIGVAMFPMDGEDVNALIKNADLAMYYAKDRGKNQFAFCSGPMKADAFNKMVLTNALYRAIEKEELVLQYQPQVRISDGEVIGFEALIRWDHPELGRISPGTFIPIAEQIGLINPIGEWVLRTACLQNKKWQDMGHPKLMMAVNISLEQMRSGNLVEIVEEALSEADLNPEYLELEITEGIAMREAQEINEMLTELKEIGVSVSIDDFGTQYSSLSRLKDLSIDRLKMDMQFVRGIGINMKDESIIKVIIHLAKSLGLKVIAEGVETLDQLNFLKKYFCDEVQGYYFYTPLAAADIEDQVFLMKK